MIQTVRGEADLIAAYQLAYALFLPDMQEELPLRRPETLPMICCNVVERITG